MSNSEEEQYFDSDSSDNEEQHSKFLSSVSQLDSTQRVKPASRREISTEVSEYNLQKGSSGKPLVQVNELAQVLKRKAKHVAISNKLKKVTGKARTLPKPLEKSAEDKLKRIIGYENVRKQIKRWDAVVEKNSLKDHLSFPLNDAYMKLQDASDFFTKFQTPTPLEAEMEKILNPDSQTQSKNETDTLEFPLTLKEMVEKRKEMAQMRARLSYKQAKAQRQNKIKSKKYHRIMKHEKVKQQLKDFEILQKTDPAKALEKLEELDKNRALERASLRHRNTGQWAKNLTVKAKYDVESRKILAEQLKMSREITKKVQMGDSSDEDEHPPLDSTHETNVSKTLTVSKDNPWSLDVSKEVEDFVSGYMKYWNEKNKEVADNCKKKESITVDDAVNATDIQDPITNSENKTESTDNSNLNVINGHSLTPKSCNINGQLKASPKKKKKNKIKGNDVAGTPNSRCSVQHEPGADLNDSELVSVRPTSGIWVITTVKDSPEPVVDSKRKRKIESINGLFSELEESLSKKATKKVKAISKKLKKSENQEVRKSEPVKSSEKALKLSLRGKELTERPDMDVQLLEGTTDETEVNSSFNGLPVENTAETAPEIDPKNFIQVKPKRLGSDLPNDVNMMDDAIDDENDQAQQKIIEEAFGEDDVIAEFKKLKNNEDEKEEVEISTSLPGWGEWGGSGIVPSKKKKRRFAVAAKMPPRKDKNKSDTIINENANPNIKNHLIRSIPYPFKSAEAFESNIKAPIGREWIPETVHHKLIQRPIETKLGTIIEPMTEAEIIRESKPYKSPYQGKKKTKNDS